jgi:hypothetical protein
MALDPFDPTRLGQPVDATALAAMRNGSAKPRLPRRAKGEGFFAGPIPLGWVAQAAALPGRAWHLACALWHDAQCQKGKFATLRPTRRTLRRFGLSDRTYYRALRALESAGLIRVEGLRGRRPLVTILAAAHCAADLHKE